MFVKCRPNCGVASPERPTGLVEGDRYDTSVAAEVITGKYGYHLPVYRQQDYFAGSGWTPARSTLLNLLVASAFVIRPLVEFFKETILQSGLLGTDETRVTLLLPKEIPEPRGDPKSDRIHEVFSEAAAAGKRSVSGRMWAYRSMTVPLNVFDFTVSRHRDGPVAFLESFTGKLMADCYSGYQGIALRSDGQIQRAACTAHARRKVFESRDAYPLQTSVVLAKFQQLYDIEDRAKTVLAGRTAGVAASGSRADLDVAGRVARRRNCRPGAAQEPLRRSVGVSPQPLAAAAALSERRADADRQQRSRAVDEAGLGGLPPLIALVHQASR